jgi:phosphate acyltransferase
MTSLDSVFTPLSEVILAVDCMGGDAGMATTLPACRLFLQTHPQARLILVGLEEAWAAAPDLVAHARVSCVTTTEVVEMHDPVDVALRRKKRSSMRLAIEQVRDGAAHVAVSSGNTGALMAIARYVLKTIEGIDRPAIASQMPNTKGGGTTMLDLGANVDCAPEHLLQFAVMGSALVAATTGQENPSVGLLNIGEEAIKGGDNIKRAGDLLRHASEHGDLNFYGNVEGNDIFKGTTDIVVCDGFVGNVTLKASEGLANMVSELLKQEFSRNLLTKAVALVSLPVLSRFKERVDHKRYNGAALLGLRGLVFKSHGSADAYAFGHALSKAYDAAQHRLVERVQVKTAQALGVLDAATASTEPV